MTNVHTPKLAALMAQAEGKLSEGGRTRLGHHLQACAVCQRAAQIVAAHESAVRDVRALPLPEMDWNHIMDRVDARLQPQRELASGVMRRAPAGAETGSNRALADARTPTRRFAAGWGAGVATMALAACALLAYRMWPDGGPSGQRRAKPPSQAAPRAAAPKPPVRLKVTVVALQGRATVTRGGGSATVPLDPRQPLSEGDRLAVDGAGLIDLAIEGGGRARLESDSRATLARLASNRVSIALHRGTVIERVAPQRDGARYEVESEPWRVRVTGTHFSVTRVAEHTDVALAEGSVEVLDAQGLALTRLTAPARWHSDPDQPSGTRAADELRLPSPYGSPDLTLAPLATLPELPTVRAWQRGDAVFGAPGELRMRAPPGLLDLQAVLHDGRTVPVSLEVASDGLTLSAARLQQLVPALAPKPRAGRLEPEQLMQVVRDKRPALQRCYELALRRTPSLQPEVSLRIALRADGRVRRVRVGGQAPSELVDCIDRAVSRWRFPTPHGPLTFDLPMRFRPRR